MKNFFLLLTGLVLATSLHAATDTIPAYVKKLKLPDFKLLLPDSVTNFYTEHLDPKKTTVLISFSPECDHCKLQTKEIIEHIEEFKDVQFVMATTLPFGTMKAFYDEYKIASYKNIFMGRDVLYFFPKYFRNHSFPLLVVYNKKQQPIHYFDGGVSITELIKATNE
jgi:thiol-disulfide isomerase/thioredoxin